MRTLKTLKPGQRGTRHLLSPHGSTLLCVRYRYDEVTRERLKTVEWVVQHRSRQSETEHSGARVPGLGRWPRLGRWPEPTWRTPAAEVRQQKGLTCGLKGRLWLRPQAALGTA